MESFRVKIRELDDYPKDYGEMFPAEHEEIMDKIIEEMRDKLGKKYLSHVITSEWIEDKNKPKYCVGQGNGGPYSTDIPYTEIPVGTKFVWAKVYIEDR